MTATVYIVGLCCLLVGWFAHSAWEEFLDWLAAATGAAGGVLWDLCAIVGVIAVCAGLFWAVSTMQ